jgi:NADH:ubiquinone oxidoreductase subunit K
MTPEYMLYLSALLFCSGLLIVITKRNAIMILLGIELMLNASNINFAGFNLVHSHNHDGQMASLFVIVVAVCEAAVGLAIILQVYRQYKTAVPDQISELKD